MVDARQSTLHDAKKLITRPVFWGVLLLMIAIILLHYLTPQERSFFSNLSTPLSRHSLDRILFLLPVAFAVYAFGRSGGLITLFLAVCAMVPRIVWISPLPLDALLETIVTGLVGYLLVWMFEVQSREKALRQHAALRLSAINEIAGLVTGSLDLNEILHVALDRTMEVVGAEGGLLFTLDPQTQELTLAVHRGVPAEFVDELCRTSSGERLCERVARSGEMLIVQEPPPYISDLVDDGRYMQAIVPLKSRKRVRGVLSVISRHASRPLANETALLNAVGHEIGVAIENAQLYESMRSYAHSITHAQEDERQRIARELHDETIQMLIALTRQLEALNTIPEPLPAAARERIAAMRDLTGRTVSGLRRFVRDLRPPVLDQLGLVAALREMTADIRETHDIHATVDIVGEMMRLRPEQELVLFRIAQEALNNIRQHAGASRAIVILAFDPDNVQMVIEDNGGGFDAPEHASDLVSSGRLGLIGMDERASALGGTLSIRSTPGRGTTVIVNIPVQHGLG